MLRRERFHAIRGGFGIEIFEKFSRPQNFASGIARDRAEIRIARRRQALPRGMKVLKHCAKRRHAATREIACDSQRISDRKFRKFFAAAKFLRPESRKIAPQILSALFDDTQ